MDFHMDGLPPDAVKRLLEELPEVGIAPSGLVGVVAVANVVEDAGIAVEVLSIEVRNAGALIHWRSRADRTVGLFVPEVSITDDRGTAYRVSAASGGGDQRSWAGEMAVVPAPPPDAMLSIEITSFGADPRMGMPGWTPNEPVQGRWQFAVDTRDIRRP